MNSRLNVAEGMKHEEPELCSPIESDEFWLLMWKPYQDTICTPVEQSIINTNN